MTPLHQQLCQACTPDSEPVLGEQREKLMKLLPGWQCLKQDNVWQLKKSYRFKNYRQSMAFANQVAELAEQIQHHPALLIEWGQVDVSWWTHSIANLHYNDFIMAAKTDQLNVNIG
ncbi:4a-hydroxytetrahydrobiopterin dehydratase [Motilimonas cestriensis]|uniref:Putative pterin-4-alpha-carbinolamine dehydratase n=1 Tax=Motilimonas cestriensis TaxID=2742685 RepID=A0ABS8WDF0_9GAMM|nr:4a-hydroxytetrahydrobiopterin dehydratase [Motilimonas cestriensis]MCE2595370.1 4a-hydroxytetrahydrobiopterin dehydratase [Motilimonas cestriensis]